MITASVSKRVLLLCAETYSKYMSKNDRTSWSVFGDAGAATIIERSDSNKSIGPFILRTDGRGKDKLIVRESDCSQINIIGNPKQRLFIDGPGIFMFTMQRVPECVEEL